MTARTGGGTRIKMNTDLIVPMEPVIPAQGSQEEAMAEAKRCLRCSCDALFAIVFNALWQISERSGEEVELRSIGTGRKWYCCYSPHFHI